MPMQPRCLPGGMLFLSGILEADVDTVTDRAQQFGFERLRTRTRSGWAVVRFQEEVMCAVGNGPRPERPARETNA